MLDLNKILDSTGTALILLDGALRVTSFTSMAKVNFPSLDADRGRPLADVACRLDYPELAADLDVALHKRRTVEREVGNPATGSHYLVRLLPQASAEAGPGHGNAVAAPSLAVTLIDVTGAYQAQQALRDSEERFRMMAAVVPAFLFIGASDAQWEYVNPPFYAFTGMAEGGALGMGWLAAVKPEDLWANQQQWRPKPEDPAVREYEVRMRRADGAWRWFLVRAVPQLDAERRPLRWFGSCTDIDERRRAEARQSVLLAEVQHGAKNILAVVRSVLTRTLETSTDPDHFASHIAGRIGTLARMYNAAGRTVEQTVMLEHLLHDELNSHGAFICEQVLIEGPPVALRDRVAVTMGLLMHELTTNALKYGALATPSGRVSIRWGVASPVAADAGLHLSLVWRETGVPVINLTPRHRGFGRELIEHGLPYDLGAVTELRFQPGGIRCKIDLPLPNSRKAASALAGPA